MTVSHLLILGVFVFIGSLGLSAVQASTSRMVPHIKASLRLQKSSLYGQRLDGKVVRRKLAWK